MPWVCYAFGNVSVGKNLYLFCRTRITNPGWRGWWVLALVVDSCEFLPFKVSKCFRSYNCIFAKYARINAMVQLQKMSDYRGILVKLVMHQISVDKIENPCYWINRCTFDMVLPSILSTQYWASLIFSPSIVIGKIDHFCVPRGQRRFFITIEANASICSWEVCFCCCTH